MKRFGYREPRYNHQEEFDPEMARLNNLSRLVAYCDSTYAEETFTSNPQSFEYSYPDVVSTIIRKRFYHGYSSYNFKNNYVGLVASRMSVRGLGAIVIPDDILKYPFAACSQQSIVFMEILRQKGFVTRKVGFKGKIGGHFCFEVYYNGNWHFIDPDMEPDVKVLNAYNRPDFAFLVHHQDILLQAYAQYPKEKVLDIFSNYYYGKANTFAAPKAIIFQYITKFFSYTIWVIFFLAFILFRRKYLQLSRQHVRNNGIHSLFLQQGKSSVVYPNYSA